MKHLHIVFTNLPGGPDSPAELVEVEDDSGFGVSGALFAPAEFHERDDGLAELRVSALTDDQGDALLAYIAELESAGAQLGYSAARPDGAIAALKEHAADNRERLGDEG